MPFKKSLMMLAVLSAAVLLIALSGAAQNAELGSVGLVGLCLLMHFAVPARQAHNAPAIACLLVGLIALRLTGTLSPSQGRSMLEMLALYQWSSLVMRGVHLNWMTKQRIAQFNQFSKQNQQS